MVAGPVMIDLAATELSAEDAELLRHPAVGAVILFSRNYENPAQLQGLVAQIRAARETPLLVAVDQEGGRVQRFRDGFTRLPPMSALGSLYEENSADGLLTAELCGWVLAGELRAHGVDLGFAPVVDLDFGASAVIGDRAFHDDPDVVFRLARALITGMRAGGMAATAKHFPGHGGVTADSHVDSPVEERSLEDLKRWDMLPFSRLARMDLASVMMAHVIYPDVDSVPASFSGHWIQDILRHELGFSGAVIADDLCMAGAAVIGGPGDRALAALDAGCDLLPVCNDRAAAIAVIDAVGAPDLPATRLRLSRLLGQESQATTPGTSLGWQDARQRIAGLEH